jgi:predicted Zn-dependent peptidase
MAEFPVANEVLPGGLRAVLLPRKSSHTISFLVLMGVGSRFETPKQGGLSHFLEHLFFKGTKTRPTSKEIAEAVDTVGGEFNAFTSEEYTGFYVTVAADYLNRAADVVSDILLRPLFDPEELEREKGVIVEEIRMYTGNPMAHVQHLWHEALFGAHPLGRRIDGTEETVQAFTRHDFVKYVAQHYHTSNAVVAVAGNFEVEPTLALIRNLFAPLPTGTPAKPKPVTKHTPAHKLQHEYRKSLEQTHIVIGVPGVSLQDPDRFAAQLLAVILGGGMSSRLFLSIRERRGLAYAVRTAHEGFTDSGQFATQAGVRTDKALEATKLIIEEYDRVMAETVGEDELAKAKTMLYGHLMLDLEESNSLAMFAASQEVLTGTIRTPQQLKEAIEATMPQDIQRVARRLLAKKNRAMALLGPQRKSEPFATLLT